MFYDTSWGHLTSFSCHLQIICRFFFQPNDHFISPRVCKPVVIHPSYLTTMANFVPPSSRPIIEDCPDIGPAFCPRMVLRPEDELAGGWRASSGLRGSTGIAARDEVDLGAEHSTGGGGERERSVRSVCWRTSEEADLSTHLCWCLWSLQISADLCWSLLISVPVVVEGVQRMSRPLVLTLALGQISLGEFLYLLSLKTIKTVQHLHWGRFLLVNCLPCHQTKEWCCCYPEACTEIDTKPQPILLPLPMLMLILRVMLMPELRVLCRLQLPIERRLLRA